MTRPRNATHDAFDRAADAYGTARLDDFFGDGDPRAAQHQRDLQAIPRRLHELPAAPGEADLADDPFAPDPRYVSQARSPDAPNVAQQLHRAAYYEGLAHRAANQPPEPERDDREAAPDRHSPQQAEMAERLWAEFNARHPGLDSAAVEAAGRKYIGEFDPNNRSAFYDAIAEDVRSARAKPDTDGRTAGVSTKGSAAALAAIDRLGDRPGPATDLIGQMQSAQKTSGYF